MEEKPSYYSILTADVRYDERLTPNEKLLYSEITSLLQKSGVCWASNRYFAELYKVSKETVSRWINHLYELNYICVQITTDVTTKQVLERTITMPTIDYLKSIPIDKNVNTPIDNFVNTPIDKNVKDNNINNNNTSINIYCQVCDYLNEKCGTHYKSNTPKTQQLIRARQNEKFSLDDFKKVIDNMSNRWKGTDMEQYLRPETLFGTKFESYLNVKPLKKNVDFATRNYTKEEMDIFDNLDEVEI